MRVAYLVNQYPKVSHTFIRREIHALEARGLEVRRYSIRPPESVLPDPKDQAEVERTRVLFRSSRQLVRAPLPFLGRTRDFGAAAETASRLGWKSDRGLLPHAAYLAEACALLTQLRSDECQHVHAHFGTNPATVAWLCHLLGGPPFSFTVHGPEEFDRAPLIGLTEKLRAAKFVVAISDFGRSQLLRRLPTSDWHKVHVVRCGIEPERQASAPTEVPDDPRLCCIGRFSEQKGHPILLQAAARLGKSGRSFRLVLIGDGELRPEVEQTVEREHLHDQIEITGYLPEHRVLQELDRARALVLPSFAEGLPVVIMEAMARARPVLSTFVAGIPELVVPGRNGWLVPAGSVDALAQTMEQVLKTPSSELQRLGRAARHDVIERHDIARSAATLEQLFTNP